MIYTIDEATTHELAELAALLWAAEVSGGLDPQIEVVEGEALDYFDGSFTVAA